MDEYSNFLNPKDFCDKYNINCSNREYIEITKAIPTPFKTVTQVLVHASVVPQMRSLSTEGVNLGGKHFTNKFIRNVLSAQYYPFPRNRKYVL